MARRFTVRIRAPPHKRDANIIARRVSCVESHCSAADERDSLGLKFPCITGRRPVVRAVQQFVRLCASKHKHTYVLGAVMCPCPLVTGLPRRQRL
jgi:hypothetical protein